MDHIKVYRQLYVSEFLEKKREKILQKLLNNQFQPNIYLITLAQNQEDELEFYSTFLLRQHVYEDTPIFLVGLAEGYDDALDMVEMITDEVYQKTGNTDIRNYIMENENQESEA
ncbi:MAG: hypothetical protein PHQ72_15000 [Hespellia sp.]|nr:hypothetical protein [Hespellia sp.]